MRVAPYLASLCLLAAFSSFPQPPAGGTQGSLRGTIATHADGKVLGIVDDAGTFAPIAIVAEQDGVKPPM